MLIRDNYNIKVEKAFIVYTRSQNKLIEIIIKKEDFDKVEKILKEIIYIIDKGFYPKATKYKKRCSDCCYRNICVQ